MNKTREREREHNFNPITTKKFIWHSEVNLIKICLIVNIVRKQTVGKMIFTRMYFIVATMYIHFYVYRGVN